MTGAHGSPDQAPRPADGVAAPTVVDRERFTEALMAHRAREKAHTHEGDAIAAARRRLPMVEVDGNLPLDGPDGPLTLLDAFEGRRETHRLLLHVAPRSPGISAMRGMHLLRGTDLGTRPSELARHHLRRALPGTVCPERSVPTFHGVDLPVVLVGAVAGSPAGRAEGRPVSSCLLPAPRRPGVRDVLDRQPRCGGPGLHLRAHGPNGVRPSGALGGLPGRVAPHPDAHAYTFGCSRLDPDWGVAERASGGAVVTYPGRTIRRSRRWWRGNRYRGCVLPRGIAEFGSCRAGFVCAICSPAWKR